MSTGIGFRRCSDCSAEVGDVHDEGCDVARCMAYGSQRIQCQPGARMVVRGRLPNGGVDVDWVEDGHDCGQDVWSGRWPGEAECEEFGWAAVFVPYGSPSWRPVPPGTPGAVPDLNRLVTEASWDAAQGRWVRRPDVTGEFESPDSPGRDSPEPPPTGANQGASRSAKPLVLPSDAREPEEG